MAEKQKNYPSQYDKVKEITISWKLEFRICLNQISINSGLRQ